MTKVFVDSDVILDYFYKRQPFYESATKIIDLCVMQKIIGYTSPLIIANLYLYWEKLPNMNMFYPKLKNLLKFISVLEMDKKVALKGLNSNFKDFEDALQNFTAKKNDDIKTILTINLKDNKKSALNVNTPESFLITIN